MLIRRVLLWLWVLLGMVGQGAAQQGTVSLVGAHPTLSGDRPDYADPEFDDSNWPRSEIPSRADWDAQGGSPRDTVRWQRITVQLAAESIPQRPALLMGMTAGGDQVFVNGVEIGASATLRAPWNQMRTANWSRAWPRLYPFDAALLREGENVIAIRFSRAIRNNAAVLVPPFELGEHGALILRYAEVSARTAAVSRVMNTVFLLVLIGLVVSMAIGFRDRAFVTFTGVYVLAIVGLVYLSPTVQESGWELPEVLAVYAQRSRIFGTLILVEFVASILRVRVPLWLRVVQLATAGLALIFPYDDGGILTATREARYYLVLFGVLTVTLVAAFWSLRALLRGDWKAGPFCLGFLALFGGIGFEYLGDSSATLVAIGVGTSDISITIMLPLMALVAAMNVRQTQRKLRDAQNRTLEAHEMERRRVAYDIHDGVGQWLSTIKLNLQLLKSQHRGTAAEEGFSEVVSHVDEAISDTRRIAHDLSPAMIEKLGLAAAMKSHADMVSRRSSVKLNVVAEGEVSLSPTEQGHLYRIFQEALQNAIKHGQATKIEVRLRQSRRGLRFEMRDNGGGFAPGETGSGLGLASMEQRAALIGASFAISPSTEGGSKVVVETKL